MGECGTRRMGTYRLIPRPFNAYNDINIVLLIFRTCNIIIITCMMN